MGDSTTTSNTNTAITTVTKNQIQSLPNIANQLPVKLNSINYLLWKAQLLSLLNSYDLVGHVNGSKAAPNRVMDKSTQLITTGFDKINLS